MSENLISNGVDIDFGDNPGLERFTSIKAFKDFIQYESVAWNAVLPQLREATTSMGTLQQPFKAMTLKLSDVVLQANSLPDDLPLDQLTSRAELIIKSYLEPHLYHSRSPVGLYVLNNEIPILSRIGFLLFYLAQSRHMPATNIQASMLINVPGMFNPVVIDGMIAAKLKQDGIDSEPDLEQNRFNILASNFSAVINDAKIQLSQLENQTHESSEIQSRSKELFDKIIDGNTAQFGNLITESSKKLDELERDHGEKFENIRQAFGEQMKLQAPINYWSASSERHAGRSREWFRVFLVLVTVTLAGIVGVGFALKTIVTYLEQDLGPFQWFLIGVPTVLILWVVRAAHRQWMTHSGLANDAEERVTMLETYLALTMEGKVDAVERPLVLNPLFRPSAVKADDGMPGGILDHIVETLNRAK